MTTTSPSELRMAINSNIEILTQMRDAGSSVENTAESSSLSDEDSSVSYSSYAELCYFKTKDEEQTRVLLAMIIGQNCDDLRQRFDEHVKAGRLQKASIRLHGKIEYLGEINRRAHLLEDKPRPKQWKNDKMLKWLEDNPNVGSEADWISSKFASIILKLDEEALNDVVAGSNIRKSDKYKMRLYEAVFLDKFRDLFF